MGFLDRSFRFAGIALIVLGIGGPARAADLTGYPASPAGGVACDVGWAGWYTLLPAYWTSVWLGHFSGGRSYYDRQRGVEALVWGDQKRCFPSHRACATWVAALRRDFHRPAGYWTCMPLR